MNNQLSQYRLYGRTKGRSKKKNIYEKYKSLLLKYKIINLKKDKKYILDIGTGYGETSVYLASKYNDHDLIACEKFIDGNINLIKKIEQKNLKNVFIFDSNVNEILDKLEKKKYFEIVNIFFPDPWPKKKHFKRRLITTSFLKKIYSYLNFDGIIYIATDSETYTQAILKCIYDTKDLYCWSNQMKLHYSIKDYLNIETKFYKKAIISGRKPILFILKKI